MLDQVRAWLRRKYKCSKDRMDLSPPYDCISPTSRALTPFAQRDPISAAIYYAVWVAEVITARAFAEQQNTGKALETALIRIQTTIPEFVRAYKLEHEHHVVEYIWAQAIAKSADTAHLIAQSDDRLYAIKLASRTEAELADGSVETLVFNILNYLYPGGWGFGPRYGLSTAPWTEQREEIVEQVALKTSPKPPTYRACI